MELTVQIKGTVQGVFFRAHAQEMANKLGLTGWVKNEPDGSVTTCAQGPKEKLEQYLEWCRRGPDSAEVETVDFHFNKNPQEKFSSFEIRH